jgi:ferritin-like metal-binding protein YciE
MDLEEELGDVRSEIDQLEGKRAPAEELKEGYERAGSLHANFIVLKQAIHAMEAKIIKDREKQKQLEERIEYHRNDLENNIGNLEKEIVKARQNVEQKGVESARLRKKLIECASFLVEQLYPKDECRDLFMELEEFSNV